MKITNISCTRKKLDLDPAFPAAWDSRPRTSFSIDLVKVECSNGEFGIGSGDAMHGIEDYKYLFIGQDPRDIPKLHALVDNASFHAGRLWPLENAFWDLKGKIENEPVWKMVGGRSNEVGAYASSGTLRSADEMVAQAKHFIERGFKAMKMRFGRPSIDKDFEVLAAVRDAVGSQLEIMVDCNQGWRMPWDTQAPWELNKALEVAGELEKYGVYWMEEPLHRGDYAGMRKLRSKTDVRIAGGEMTRDLHEFHTLMDQECLDVLQPDCCITGGIFGLKQIAEKAHKKNLIFTPHTWGNGIGLLANAHLTAGTVGAPFLEFPYDPPEWTNERRDFVFGTAIDINPHGNIVLSDAPGLGLPELK